VAGTGGCKPPQSKLGTPISLDIPVDKSRYVVLPNNWNLFFKHDSFTTLIPSEIDTIEIIVYRAVQEYNKHASEEKYGLVIEPLSSYNRQYVPAISSSGQKVVWINFFCNDGSDHKWKKSLVRVEDGGSCYFNLKINLTSKIYYDLRVNGVG
jgi:hypothetical protein